MSFGIFDIASRAKTHAKTEAAKARAALATSAARDAQASIAAVEKRLDKLALISMALWSFLSEKCSISEEDLAERVKKIDAMDGSTDGKLQGHGIQCPKCGRAMSSRHTKCLFCGAEREQMTPFDEVI